MSTEIVTILEELKEQMIRTHSPWADRSEAAAYCHCSASEIDKAANEGKIKRYWRNNTPMFKKQGPKSLDEWIENAPLPPSRLAARIHRKASQTPNTP